ncbi:MAG: sensor histidine kinase [Deltaproteobacteria bacterium]|nr:sensor histidine kinase [Deltaproteobacteria bacterium]
MAFLVLGIGFLSIESWSEAFGVTTPIAWVWWGCMAAYTVVAQLVTGHSKHGRRVLFVTLIFDLLLLLMLIKNTGGLQSPIMAAQLLFTVFFALLFPSPIAILPPVMMLPLIVRLSHDLPQRPTFSVELLYLLWTAALNGIAVYVIVYLTGQEERRHREIVELEGALKRLAVHEERNRLARDIHDGLGALMSGLIIQAEYIQTLVKNQPELLEEVCDLKSAGEESIDEIRRALSMMRDEFDLVEQLENTCTTFTTRHKIPARLTLHGEPSKLTEEQELTVFRIMQECLTNAAKHAHAEDVHVEVFFEEHSMRMSITDDGRGFDPTKTPKHHYGLLNMKERAKKANGSVDISSEPGVGTRIELLITCFPEGTPHQGVLSASIAGSQQEVF